MKKIVWDISFTFFSFRGFPKVLLSHWKLVLSRLYELAASAAGRSRAAVYRLQTSMPALCELPNFGIDALLEDLSWFLTS